MTHVISWPFIRQGMNIPKLNIDWLRMPIDKFGQTIGCGHSVKACLTLWPLLLWPFVGHYFVAIRRVAIWHCGQVTHTLFINRLQ